MPGGRNRVGAVHAGRDQRGDDRFDDVAGNETRNVILIASLLRLAPRENDLRLPVAERIGRKPARS